MKTDSTIIQVPFSRPSLVSWEKINSDFREVWESGQITCGKLTRKFEVSMEQALEVRHAIAVSSGTAGLMLVLKAIEAEGEVILPSFSFPATLQAVCWNGCTPVFADCEEETYGIDAHHVEQLISSRTCAVLPVYLYGMPPDIERLQDICKRHHLKLIFDSASAMGARYRQRLAGPFGDAEVFSLSPGKVVTAVEGGVITTNDDSLAEQIKGLRNSGKMENGFSPFGLNARMSEFHAGVGYKNFAQLNDSIQKRGLLIQRYKENLGKIKGIRFQGVSSERISNNNYMVIFLDPLITRLTRDGLCHALQKMGIETKRYFSRPLHRLVPNSKVSLPRTDHASETCLALPLYEAMPPTDVEDVCDEIAEILETDQTS